MATELRVHGVSGSRAEDILDRPLLSRVAGDGEAGFFRPREAYGDTTGPGGAALEAYRWGNLTSGTATRALWLLLLPFMLANVATRLRPATPGRALVTRALCRIFAATITVAFVLSMVGISLDLVAWQCAPYQRCTADRPYLSWLTNLQTGPRLAVVSVVPFAAIALLWWLGSRTWRSYESFRSDRMDRGGDGLDAARCWDGKQSVGRLRSVHVAVGFGAVDAILAFVLARHDGGAVGYGILFAVLAMLALAVLLLCLPAIVDRDSDSRWVEVVAGGLRSLALLLTAVTLGYAFVPRDRWVPTVGSLPGYGSTVTYLFVVQTGLLLLLALVVLLTRLRRRGIPTFLFGLGAPVLGSVAVGVAVAFSAGAAYRVADFLDRGGVPSPAEVESNAVARLQPPVSYEWAALGFAVAVVVTVLVALVATRVARSRLRRAAVEVTGRDYPDAPASAGSRLDDVRRAIVGARSTDRIEGLLALAYAPLALLSLAFTWYAIIGTGPVELAAQYAGEGSPLTRVVSFTTNLGTYLIGLFAIGLVVLGLLAYRYAGIRRVIGVAWDLGTFWPRSVHPLAPPCYAERAVPELARRVRALAEHEPVILSGHSQGSVLVAAALLQLPAETRERVALLTYGSPLRRLYARLFPAYVGADLAALVWERVGGRWLNLWRDTDPIGSWIFAPDEAVSGDATVDGFTAPADSAATSVPKGTHVTGVDWRLRDPRGVGVEPGDTVPPAIEGHSGYPSDRRFDAAVIELVNRLAAGPASPGQRDPRIPAVGVAAVPTAVPAAEPPAARSGAG